MALIWHYKGPFKQPDPVLNHTYYQTSENKCKLIKMCNFSLKSKVSTARGWQVADENSRVLLEKEMSLTAVNNWIPDWDLLIDVNNSDFFL